MRLPWSKRRGWSWSAFTELAARFGYGARGFVYVSIGALTLLAALDRIPSPGSSTEVFQWLADQPFARFWLLLLGIGLWAFVGWRVLQSVFDADHEGRSLKAWGLRAGQAMSGVFYGILAATVFELIDESQPGDVEGEEASQQAATVLNLPFGDWLLLGVGLAILGIGIGNIIKGARGDFAGALACGPDICRRVVPMARAGYIARGVAYLPLALFVILSGLRARASEARDFAASLDALENQPFGPWILGVTALGLMAFGAFAFVEARWRRIRPPSDLKPG